MTPANCCCIEIDEPSDVWCQKLIRAHKPHQCTECGDAIQAGALYERIGSLYDGRWTTFKTCARCCNIRDEYFKCGWYAGNIVEDFRECFGFDYRDGIPADFAPCKGTEP